MEVYTLTFDGSCGPKNPGGTAAYGFRVVRAGQEILSQSAVIGDGPGMTNNLAEFTGLAAGMQRFMEDYAKKGVILNVRGDSQLVINIMSRRWKAKSDRLYYSAYQWAVDALHTLRTIGVTVNFDWIPREQNQECDDLSKARLSAKVA